MRRNAAGEAAVSGRPACLSRRAAQLLALVMLLLLAGPMTQFVFEWLLPSGVRHARRGEREEPHRIGMAAFVGSDAALQRAVSAVSSWHAEEAARQQAQRDDDATHAELERLHAQQREMVQLHLAGAGDQAEQQQAEQLRWAQVSLACASCAQHAARGVLRTALFVRTGRAGGLRARARQAAGQGAAQSRGGRWLRVTCSDVRTLVSPRPAGMVQ